MNIRFTNARILRTHDDRTFEIIEGELWVKKDVICYIGSGDDVSDVITGQDVLVWDRVIDCDGNLIIPGFKNAHTHTAMTFLRSYADDLPLWDWLTKLVFPKEAYLTEDDIYWLTILGFMEYLTSGITANFDMYFHPKTIAKAASDIGFRTVQTSSLNNTVSNLGEVEEAYLAVNEMSPLTSYVFGFHAEYTTDRNLMEGVARLSDKYSSPVWYHNSETAKEVKECISRYDMTPTEIGEKLGLFEHGGGGYHCIYLSDHDMEIFKKRDLYAVTNPGSNVKLASGIAPIATFLERGIPVAIGTDGPASNNALDMFREMHLTTTLAKLREMDAATVPAEEVLYSATTVGAHAMGLLDCDCLAVGKQADLAIIDLRQPNMQPMNSFVKNLVYSGSKQNVVLTMVAGEILYEKMEFHLPYSADEIYQRANEIIDRIK